MLWPIRLFCNSQHIMKLERNIYCRICLCKNLMHWIKTFSTLYKLWLKLFMIVWRIISCRFNWEEIILQNVNAVHHPKSTQEVHVQEVFNPFHIAFSSQFKSSIKGTSVVLLVTMEWFVNKPLKFVCGIS